MTHFRSPLTLFGIVSRVDLHTYTQKEPRANNTLGTLNVKWSHDSYVNSRARARSMGFTDLERSHVILATSDSPIGCSQRNERDCPSSRCFLILFFLSPFVNYFSILVRDLAHPHHCSNSSTERRLRSFLSATLTLDIVFFCTYLFFRLLERSSNIVSTLKKMSWQYVSICEQRRGIVHPRTRRGPQGSRAISLARTDVRMRDRKWNKNKKKLRWNESKYCTARSFVRVLCIFFVKHK